MPGITADELYQFIRANAEQLDGQRVCRASIIEELRRRGVERPQHARVVLVGELERRGLVSRPNPRSRWLVLIGPSGKGRSFSCDVIKTRERLSQLRAYMRRNVLHGDEFVCASFDACKSSIPTVCTFTEGQLSHVGKRYDLTTKHKPLRVVVVGQEVGAAGPARVGLGERYRLIHNGSGLGRRFQADATHKRRNPHMRGTTLALRAIFRNQGIEHATEFLDVDGESVHMFDCFALVNRLLCSSHLVAAATGKQTSTGRPTSTMFTNCERHFAATLEILEPTIVVMQGVTVWRRSQRVLVPKRQLSHQLIECDLKGQRVLVCAFTHPSAWGAHGWAKPHSPYLTHVVQPTLQMAIDRL